MKRNLWDQIRQLRNADLGGLWCILGDFNSIRRQSERVGISQRQQDERVVMEFNEWIADLEVDDMPCVGRKYTWYRPNGAAKSRLDRILVSDEWLIKWQGTPSLFWRGISQIIAQFCCDQLMWTGVQNFLGCWTAGFMIKTSEKWFENGGQQIP